ncbi:MAG: MBOAT family O-acyltransferase [Terracidiphilus sp.]|jgi:D-alanyl-lipoteichoic acid acyltransferase DltB (MBOAT superfamily)
MDNASFQFVLFGLAVALVSNISRSRVWRSIVLMAASIVFLGLLAHDPIAFLPLLGFLLLGYAALVLLERGWLRSTAWSIAAVILVYIWLKKYTFLPAGSFLRDPYFTLGLSYIFFRVLHLIIETGDSSEKRHIGLGAYLLYTLNFTTLLSGPIQRYDEFARDQFAPEPIVLGARTIGLQLERIIRGFFKVNVLAMLFHAVQEDALAQMVPSYPLSLRLFASFKLAVVYPFFLYANFSGYIDIVIALARLMRVRLPENFDRPFSASSFVDFWNRWHITLSTWLKTYVYNPLLMALMRRISSIALEPLLGVFCFFVTFFLVGIWHGRTSEFVIFGVLQGGGVAINKLWQLGLARGLGRKSYKALAKNSAYIAFGRGLTFSWFAFSLFWFWAGWKQLVMVSTAIAVAQWLGVWLTIWLCATVVLALWETLRSALLSIKTAEGPVLTSRYARVVYASALGLAAVVITLLLNQPAPDIVYKAF